MTPADWHTLADLIDAVYRALRTRHAVEEASICTALVVHFCQEPAAEA